MTVQEQKTNSDRPRALVFDCSWVIIHPVDRSYPGSLNGLNRTYGGESGLDPYPEDHPFSSIFQINIPLLDELRRIKNQYKIPFYMFTTDTIQQRPELQEVMQDIFHGEFQDGKDGNIFAAKNMTDVIHTSDLDALKTIPAAFSYIAKHINLPSEPKLYVDDKEKNIEAARNSQTGFETYQYVTAPTMEESNEKLFAYLRQFFPDKQE